jgi:negative regulator of flagellin synthesis FlgM
MSIDVRTLGSHPPTSSPGQSSSEATVTHIEHPSSHKANSDAVRLTDAGSILRTAEKLVAALPAVDAARISAVTESIANGGYVVNAERVAEKIIEFEQVLSG